MYEIKRVNDERIDELEAAMFESAMNNESDVHFIDCPLNHEFYPNLYVRQILMPKGATITSEVHKTCHPFRVLQGIVLVKIDNNQWERIVAPYAGTTYAGTRRVLYIEEETVWETFHPLSFITGKENNLSEEEYMEVVSKVKDAIIEPYVNKLIGGHVFLNKIINQIKTS
jgi:hypothetical protein